MLGKEEKKKRTFNLLDFFKSKKKDNNKTHSKLEELKSGKFKSGKFFFYLKNVLSKTKQNPTIQKLQKWLIKSENPNENVNKLVEINKTLSKNKNKDIANVIEYLTENENFLEILSTEVEYDEVTTGKYFLLYLNTLKDFLQKYIQYFPSDKLSCDAMKKILTK